MNDGFVSRFDWAKRHAGGMPIAFRAALVRLGVDRVRYGVHLQPQSVIWNNFAVDRFRKLFIDVAWHQRRHGEALAAIGAKLALVVVFVFLVASGNPHFVFGAHIPRFEVAV